ncbi:unnamed protein product [Paramecium sonneborni]|uniref:Uncharacterized protein n=1 Tax=Paramecium sonneborni TaxID=65129 RepID=A0A8S1MAA6_9CILI|nr:unnamed protein product [Paramecium sonneborni]
MITQAKKQINDDYQIEIKKIVEKRRQKNQYTKEDKFQEQFLQQKELKLQKYVEFIEVSIPKSIQLNNSFRLKSNVQIPRNANNQYKLGQLNIDFYCYNYKINRIDRHGNITTVTFDPIQKSLTPFENIIHILSRGNQYLRSSIEKLHYKKLDSSQFFVLKEQDLFNFENMIDKPCTGYISKQRFMNDLYLNSIGINYEMVIHHAMETGYLPIPLYFSENYQSLQHLSNFFILNTFNQCINNMQGCNYNGQYFPVKIEFHNYYFYNQNEKCYYEYLFFIYDIDKKWISRKKVEENYLDYFNLKKDKVQETYEYYNSEQRCGYRNI